MNEEIYREAIEALRELLAECDREKVDILTVKLTCAMERARAVLAKAHGETP